MHRNSEATACSCRRTRWGGGIRRGWSSVPISGATLGWWTSTGAGDSTRSADDVARERDYAMRYLATDGREMNWTLIRAALASVADTALIPMQDVLGLGSEARMNLPGRQSGNWEF